MVKIGKYSVVFGEKNFLTISHSGKDKVKVHTFFELPQAKKHALIRARKTKRHVEIWAKREKNQLSFVMRIEPKKK